MTERISDERLIQVQIRHEDYDEDGFRPNDGIGGFLKYEEEATVIDDLLTLRQQNAELIENSERLASCLLQAIEVDNHNFDDELSQHVALMSRIKGE